jgi:hypothetical protein
MATPLPTLEAFSEKYNDWAATRARLVKARDEKKQIYEECKARDRGAEQNHDARIESIRTGQTATLASASASTNDAYQDWSDHYEAVVSHDRLKWKIVNDASRGYNQTYIRPAHDAALKRVADALCELHAGHLEYSRNLDRSANLGIEPIGLPLFPLDDLLGYAADKGSKLAYFLRDLVAAGALTALPKELR